nr:hypothetical protein [Nonomuraea aurantiaca]
MDGLARRLVEILHEGPRRVAQNPLARHALPDLEQAHAQPVLGAAPLQQAPLQQFLGQPVDRRLGDAGAADDLGQAEALVIRAERLKDQPNLAQHAVRRPVGLGRGGDRHRLGFTVGIGDREGRRRRVNKGHWVIIRPMSGFVQRDCSGERDSPA